MDNMCKIKKVLYGISFIFVITSAISVNAQSNKLFITPDIIVEYAEVVTFDTDNNGKIDKWSYKDNKGEILINEIAVPNILATAYDTDNNGKPDLWLVYNANQTIVYEAHDTTGNGEADTIFEIDSNENIKNISGEEAEKLKRVEPQLFTGSMSSKAGISDKDLVGDLSDLGPKSGIWKILLLGFVILAIWIYYKKIR